jgi:hypothetical protein
MSSLLKKYLFLFVLGQAQAVALKNGPPLGVASLGLSLKCYSSPTAQLGLSRYGFSDYKPRDENVLHSAFFTAAGERHSADLLHVT